MSDRCDTVDSSLPGSSVHGILSCLERDGQERILSRQVPMEWVAIPFSRDLPDAGIELRPPALQADSLLSDPLGKPIMLIFISETFL